MMRMIVSEGLKNMDLGQVDVVNGGEEALSAIKTAVNSNEPYHITFLDWHMPDISGLDVLIQCRQNDEYKDMAIVMLTAEQEQQNVLKAIQSGATAYLIKPVSADALKSNIDKVLQWFEKNNIQV